MRESPLNRSLLHPAVHKIDKITTYGIIDSLKKKKKKELGDIRGKNETSMETFLTFCPMNIKRSWDDFFYFPPHLIVALEVIREGL